ncbi:hypothetical protein [Tabrizicola sp.]|uniref:hypothetical protein n=1 Tax=Tabrizicola sp. TaxID=2005166 RepID=UPI003F3A8601
MAAAVSVVRSGLQVMVGRTTLAANGHNIKPSTFGITNGQASILPDFARRPPIVDPDDHHLQVNLGPATENVLIAAAACFQADEVAVTPGN